MNSELSFGQLECFFFITNTSKIRVFECFYPSHESAVEMFEDAQYAFGDLVEIVSTPAPNLRFIQTSKGQNRLILPDA